MDWFRYRTVQDWTDGLDKQGFDDVIALLEDDSFGKGNSQEVGIDKNQNHEMIFAGRGCRFIPTFKCQSISTLTALALSTGYSVPLVALIYASHGPWSGLPQSRYEADASLFPAFPDGFRWGEL